MKRQGPFGAWMATVVITGGCMFFPIEAALSLGPYTLEARRAVSHAVQSVSRTKGDAITPEHLGMGLLEADVRAARYVSAMGVDPPTIKARIREALPASQDSRPRPSEFPYHEQTKAILRHAYAEATAGERKVTSIDILIALLDDGSSAASGIFTTAGVSVAELRRAFNSDPERSDWATE